MGFERSPRTVSMAHANVHHIKNTQVLEYLRVRFPDAGQPVRMNQVKDALGDEVVLRIAQDSTNGWTGIRDRAIGPFDQDDVGGILGEGSEMAFTVAQGFFRLSFLAAQVSFRQGLFHRRSQPGQAIFEQVIGGALLHALHRRLLADGARDDDERNTETGGLQQAQGLQRVELRQRVVGEDHVEVRV